MNTLAIFAIIVLNTATITSKEIETRLVNGDYGLAEQFPFAALLATFKEEHISICGGSLINSEWIVTAAHCLVKVIKVRVHLGVSHDDPLSMDNIHSTIQESHWFIWHENFNGHTLNHDIGLIKLPEKVVYSRYILPITIRTNVPVYEGLSAFVCGWGKLSGADKRFFNGLRYARLMLANRNLCLAASRRVGVTASRVFCARGTIGQNACYGDSGGPIFLVEPFTLIGIISYGTDCDHGISGFTDIRFYYNWLANTIRRDLPLR